jgi:hypothetical protein
MRIVNGAVSMKAQFKGTVQDLCVFRTDKGQTVKGTVSINAQFKGTVQFLCVFRTR